MAVPRTFGRTMALLMVLSVVGWAAFAWFFRTFWPMPTLPGEKLGLVAAWLVVGGGAFVALTLASFRLLAVPAAWRAAGASAFVAPAMCLDTVATLVFERWIPNAGPADDRIYPAMLLGGVAMILFAGLAATKPDEGT